MESKVLGNKLLFWNDTKNGPVRRIFGLPLSAKSYERGYFTALTKLLSRYFLE